MFCDIYLYIAYEITSVTNTTSDFLLMTWPCSDFESVFASSVSQSYTLCNINHLGELSYDLLLGHLKQTELIVQVLNF